MTEETQREPTPEARPEAQEPTPTAPPVEVPTGALATLAVLGALALALSLFLWWQLLVARAGGTPLCGFGEEGACGALWDTAFASRVHQATGVPVAGWGAVWALAALLIPLGILWNARHDPETVPAWKTALRWTALGGIAATVALAAVSVGAGIFCAGCVASYVLVLAYAGVAFGSLWGEPFVEPLPAAWIVLGLLGAGYVLAFYPGLRTPQRGGDLGREAVATALEGARDAAETAPETPDGASSTGDEASEVPQGRLTTVGALVEQFLQGVDPETRQLVADALYIYENTEPGPVRPPRFVVGSQDAPVRLVDFTHPLCPACADLHYNLDVFRQSMPQGLFSIEPRHFPLDGQCNPLIPDDRGGLRCLAAKAQICLEGRPEAFTFSGEIFEHQQELTVEKVYELASPYLARADLERCVASSETARKLEADIRYAADREISGTPLLLFNGREAPAYGPFLYALILTRGDVDHPAFDDLPPPREAVVEQARAARE